MTSKEFKAVYDKGRSIADAALVVYTLETVNNTIRVGYSVSKKVGNSVIRHKITRRLREICRTKLSENKGSFDMVIIARQKAATMNYQELSNSFENLLRRISKFRNEKTTYSNN